MPTEQSHQWEARQPLSSNIEQTNVKARQSRSHCPLYLIEIGLLHRQPIRKPITITTALTSLNRPLPSQNIIPSPYLIHLQKAWRTLLLIELRRSTDIRRGRCMRVDLPIVTFLLTGSARKLQACKRNPPFQPRKAVQIWDAWDARTLYAWHGFVLRAGYGRRNGD